MVSINLKWAVNTVIINLEERHYAIDYPAYLQNDVFQGQVVLITGVSMFHITAKTSENLK